MEELIGRYFFIVVVIFATVLDLVGRWYKNKQRRDRKRRAPRVEPREQVDWRRAQGPDRRQASALREGETKPTVPRKRASELPDFAQILLDELAPPDVLEEMRRMEGRSPVEQPMIARVVPKARTAKREVVEAIEAGRQQVRSTMPSQARTRAESARVRRRALSTLRTALEDPAAARRAVVLAEVLGPCRALEPYGRLR